MFLLHLAGKGRIGVVGLALVFDKDLLGPRVFVGKHVIRDMFFGQVFGHAKSGAASEVAGAVVALVDSGGGRQLFHFR
jgi:hypothetical protein